MFFICYCFQCHYLCLCVLLSVCAENFLASRHFAAPPVSSFRCRWYCYMLLLILCCLLFHTLFMLGQLGRRACWRGDWAGRLMLCHCAARRAERSVHSVCRRPHELLTSSSLPQVSVNVLAQLKLSAWRSHFGRQPNKWGGKRGCGGSDGGGRWTQPVALSRARHICWPRGHGQSHS